MPRTGPVSPSRRACASGFLIANIVTTSKALVTTSVAPVTTSMALVSNIKHYYY